MELQRMVRAYLPPSWCVVEVGITNSVVDIVQDGFQGSQVMVVDWSPDCTRFLYNTLQSVYTTDMHVLRPIPVDWSVRPSTGKGRGSVERPSNHVQECGSEKEMHDQVTGEVERNEVKQSKEEMEDDSTRATVEIRRPRDKSTDLEDEDTLEEDTLGNEEASEEDHNSDGEEPSGITLYSKSTHRVGGASTDASDSSYHPSRPSGQGQSSDEPATTTKGQKQEQEHDSTEGGGAHKDGNRTVEMNMEQVFGAEDKEPQSSPRSNRVHLS